MGVQIPDALIGQTLGGYTIERRLGQGGMATVYVAHQTSMHRDVAIKVMRQDLSNADPTFFSRFEREARTTAALEHLHILPVIDFGQANGYVYLVMRLLDDNLAHFIGTNPPLPLNEVSRMLTQIAEALDYAHQKGVIHRDLKPANVLLDSHHNCFLADFGIVHLMNSGNVLTADSAMIGTPAYMSPEQVTSRQITAASDVYSLGVTLYEMLCSHLPFVADTPLAMAHHHLQTRPLAPTQWRADLPDGCEKVILKALAKSPLERYPTAMSMAAAFDKAINDTALLDRSPRPVPALENDTTLFGNEEAISDSESPAEQILAKDPPTLALVPGGKRLSRRVWLGIAGLLVVIGIVSGAYVLSQRGNAAQAPAFNESGLTALAKLDYTTAIRDFEEAIRLDPAYAAAHFNLGIAYEEQGNLDAARTAYQTALKINDQLLLASYRLAELLMDSKDKTEAASGFQVVDNGIRVLQLGDLTIDEAARKRITFLLYATRGRAYLLRGTQSDLQLAESDLQQALTFKDSVPYPASAYYYLAQVYEAEGKKEEARQSWLDMLSTYDPNSARQREWAIQAENALNASQ